VVRAEDFATLVESSSLLEAARLEAEEVRRMALDAYLRERARGYEEGVMQAKQEQTERMIGLVSESIRYLEQFEHQLSSLVLESVKKILGSFSDTELLGKIVANALQIVRLQARVTVRVAPEHHAPLLAQVDDLRSGYPSIRLLEIQSDPHVAKGECVVDTEIGTVTTGIETQLEAITRGLSRVFAAGPGISSK